MGQSINVHAIKIEDVKLVYQYLEKDKNLSKSRSAIGLHGKTKYKLKKITADMLKISIRTVSRILDHKEDYHRA